MRTHLVAGLGLSSQGQERGDLRKALEDEQALGRGREGGREGGREAADEPWATSAVVYMSPTGGSNPNQGNLLAGFFIDNRC